MKPETLKFFLHGLELLDLKLDNHKISQFSVYLDELKSWNSKINLIGPASDEEIVRIHFLDSLSAAKAVINLAVKFPVSVLDVGTGAGFPGIPIKILLPEIDLTLLDSSVKRTEFLRHLCKKLDIKSKIICGRAEEVSKNPEYREKFDIVVARALAKIPKAEELCRQFLNENGNLILQAGSKTDEKSIKGDIVEKVNTPMEILPGRTILTVKKNYKGFTLIELMIVVAIIGILAALVIPKFSEMLRKSKEGKTKGELGNLRSAITLYYGDMEGAQYPGNAAAISNVTGPFQPKYLSKMLEVKLGINAHSDTSNVSDFAEGAVLTDLGDWGYTASSGKIFVNCTHLDSKGKLISSW